jgi:hypothetical protein
LPALWPLAKNEKASHPDLQVIDFHSHIVGSVVGAAAPPAQRDHFRNVNRKLASHHDLRASIEEPGTLPGL